LAALLLLGIQAESFVYVVAPKSKTQQQQQQQQPIVTLPSPFSTKKKKDAALAATTTTKVTVHTEKTALLENAPSPPHAGPCGQPT